MTRKLEINEYSSFKTDPLYQIKWHNTDGQERTDFFTTRKRATEVWGDICGELSYVHIWAKPTEGLKKFIQTLPLDMVDIIKI
jgi:hypothetical protein